MFSEASDSDSGDAKFTVFAHNLITSLFSAILYILSYEAGNYKDRAWNSKNRRPVCLGLFRSVGGVCIFLQPDDPVRWAGRTALCRGRARDARTRRLDH